MTPENTKAHDEALEALVAASLRASEKEPEITEEEISRYVDQQVTLSSEDEDALKRSKSELLGTIRKILQKDPSEKAPCTNMAVKSGDAAKQNDSSTHHRTSGEFIEAILIAELTRLLSEPEFPLGRFRYNKFAYFSHRRAEEEVHEHFLKKPAGPYSPWARYKGPEAIALRNGYVKRASGRDALLPGDKMDSIAPYLSRYPVCRAVEWVVETFRYRKNEELELLATVDFAVLDLKQCSAQITVSAVKNVIGSNTEWKPKLSRAAFADDRIEAALAELRSLFPLSYA